MTAGKVSWRQASIDMCTRDAVVVCFVHGALRGKSTSSLTMGGLRTRRTAAALLGDDGRKQT